MQYAKSMRHAGMLLYAPECDYTDFINQGLRCPNCSGTVFLVAGSDRGIHNRKLKSGESVQVKGSIVPAHFSHHSTDKAQIADCELRSERMTQAQRLVYQSQARGQVARIFRQKFFAMVKTSIKLQDVDQVGAVLTTLWQKASLKQPIAAKAQLMTLVDMIANQFAKPGQMSHSKEGLNYALEKWSNQIASDPKSVPIVFQDQFKAWSNVLDRQMQVLIVGEAIDYVCHKSQRKLLCIFVECGIYAWVLAQASCDAMSQSGYVSQKQRTQIYNNLANDFVSNSILRDNEMIPAMIRTTRMLIGLNKEAFDVLFSFVRDDIVQVLTFVNWADEFEKREVNLR